MVSITPLSDKIRKAATARQRRAVLRHAGPDGLSLLPDVLTEAKRQRRNDPADAALLARMTFVAAKASRAAPLAAQAARLLGQSDLLLGHPRLALRHLKAAAKYLGRALPSGLAAEIAQTLVMLGRSTEALEVIAQARRNLPEDVDPCERATLLGAEGNIYLYLERYRAALACFGTARRIATHSCNRDGKLVIDMNRALIYANMNRFKHAEAILARTAATYRQRGHEASALQVDYNLAYLQFLRGRFDESLTRIRGLRTKFDALHDDRHSALCDLDEAELDLRLGLRAEAEVCARRALIAFERSGMRIDAARSRYFIAVATREPDRPETSARAFLDALEAFQREGSDTWVALCMHRLAEIEWERGDSAVAMDRAEQASEWFFADDLLERGGRVEVLQARIEHEIGRTDAAVRRLRALERRLGDVEAPWLRCEVHHTLARCFASLGHRWPAARHGLEAVRILETQPVSVPPDEHGAAVVREHVAVYEDAARFVRSLGGRRTETVTLDLARRAQERARPIAAGRDPVARIPVSRRPDELSRDLGGGLRSRPGLKKSPERDEGTPEARA